MQPNVKGTGRSRSHDAGSLTIGRAGASGSPAKCRGYGEGKEGSYATRRFLRFCYARPSLTVADAADAVKRLALRGTGDASRADQVLEATLHKATGVSVAELAHLAEEWPPCGYSNSVAEPGCWSQWIGTNR